MTDEQTLTDDKARIKTEAKKLCFKDCADGRHIDCENGCFTICKSAEQCQGWTAYTHRVPKATDEDPSATIARLTAERDKWRNDCLDANQSELALRKRAEQAEAKLAEVTAAGTFAQGIDAAAGEWQNVRVEGGVAVAAVMAYSDRIRALAPQSVDVRDTPTQEQQAGLGGVDEQQMPVAWQQRLSSGGWGTILHGGDKPIGAARPLYTHSPTPQADPVRKAARRLVYAMEMFWEADEAADEHRRSGNEFEADRYDRMATGRWQNIPDLIENMSRALAGEQP